MIEIAGRTCYKSEDKITDDSANDFCRRLIKCGHDAMIEHSNIILEVSSRFYDEIFNLQHNTTKYLEMTSYKSRYILSGSVRAWRDLQKATLISTNIRSVIAYFNRFLNDLFFDLNCKSVYQNSDIFKVLNNEDLTSEERVIHQRISVRFITDRGVTHELVRHRPASFAQESTRYVKYDGDTEFIRPVFDWARNLSAGSTTKFRLWSIAMHEAEMSYKLLREQGCSAQEARSVLPNSLKAEIVVTVNIREWRYIFKLRTAKAAHPQIQELMLTLLAELKQILPALFSDIIDDVSNTRVRR
jgi:thymidylate synthase (FAD)